MSFAHRNAKQQSEIWFIISSRQVRKKANVHGILNIHDICIDSNRTLAILLCQIQIDRPNLGEFRTLDRWTSLEVINTALDITRVDQNVATGLKFSHGLFWYTFWWRPTSTDKNDTLNNVQIVLSQRY